MLLYILSMVETEEDRTLVTQLFYVHGKMMKDIAKGILKSDSLAEDAVIHAFEKLIARLEKTKIEGINSHKTKNFMVIISRNAAYDILHDETKHKSIDIDSVYESEIDSARYSNNIDEMLDVITVKSALELMPEKYIDILLLKIYHNLTDKDIALHLNISHAAVRKRLQRARAILYELLEKGELL